MGNFTDIPPPPLHPAPVVEQHRVLALDAARGLALLGILLVNVQSFAEPFGRFLSPRPKAQDIATQASFYFVKVCCEGKFFTLFSLLFGMGLILQRASIERSAPPGTFRWVYLRRLFILLLLGAAHALLLWYGDILFMYALAGTILFACSRFSAKVLLWVAVILLLISTLFGAAMGSLQGLGNASRSAATITTSSTPVENSPALTSPAEANSDRSVSSPPSASAASPSDPAVAPASPVAPPARTPDGLDDLAKSSSFFRLMAAYRDGRLQGGPDERIYMDLENLAYRDGPWLDSFLFRAMTWMFFLMFSILGLGWQIVAMFFLGAGLLKAGFFDPGRAPLRQRFALIGLRTGLPLAALGVYLGSAHTGILAGAATMGLTLLCGPPVAVAYLSAVSLITEMAFASRAIRVLAAVGRMALTNYLTHTLVCTFIFYHWGFAQFGQWTRPERLMLALALFAAQCLLSPVWLSLFRFGPMEWLWRSLTYLKWQPILRARGSV